MSRAADRLELLEARLETALAVAAGTGFDTAPARAALGELMASRRAVLEARRRGGLAAQAAHGNPKNRVANPDPGTGKPSGKPSGKPTEDLTGKPSGKPTGKPTVTAVIYNNKTKSLEERGKTAGDDVRDWLTDWVAFAQAVTGTRPTLSQSGFLAASNALRPLRDQFTDREDWRNFLRALKAKNPGAVEGGFPGWAVVAAGKVRTLADNLHQIRPLLGPVTRTVPDAERDHRWSLPGFPADYPGDAGVPGWVASKRESWQTSGDFPAPVPGLDLYAPALWSVLARGGVKLDAGWPAEKGSRRDWNREAYELARRWAVGLKKSAPQV